MASVTLTAPPPPFACSICALPQWQDKAGEGCAKCSAFKDTHYHPSDIGVEAADIIILGDSPPPPPLLQLVGGRHVEKPMHYHPTFEDTGGKVLRQAVMQVLSRREFMGLNPYFTYAVKCSVDKAKSDIIQSCSKYLYATVANIVKRREEAKRTGPLTVIACGRAALQALGLHPGAEEDELNRVIDDVPFGGTKLQVVPTRSLKSVGAAGKFNMLLADVERAALIAQNRLTRTAPRAEIEKEYRYPKSLREVEELVSEVIAYTEENMAPLDWKIAIDTETNTLHPNWDGTKLLLVSFAWSKGKAASIALWHKDNTFYDPAQAYEEVKRLINSQKPLIWHNGKYDYKVFWKLGYPQGPVGNVYWDTMLAEHALEEDKKQGYSLKVLTKQRLPHLSGYEDVLQGMLEKNNDELEPEEEIEEAENAPDPNNPLGLTAATLEAYNLAVKKKIVSSLKFRAATIEKAIQKYEATDPELVKHLKLLLSARNAGDFSSSPKKEEKEEDTGLGGFEDVPLDELMFYGAVDADATRQIAVIQVRRMGEEDARLEAMRKDMEYVQKVTRDPREKLYPVKRYCTTAAPLRRLVRMDYLPRQAELAKIEYNGINVDIDYLDKGMVALTQTVDYTANSIFSIAKGTFKVNSTVRLAQLLFSDGYDHPFPEQAQALAEKYPKEVTFDGTKIKYKPFAYTAKGAIQTSDGVLKALTRKYECPLSNLILTYKKAFKARNTFFTNIRTLASFFGDKKLRAGYGLINTSTGRLSSRVKIGKARFNAQNIPKGWIGALKDLRGEYILDAKGRKVFEGVNCKKLFIPDDDSYCFGNADAKGAEVTIYAAYSNDAALIEALRAGLDPHGCFRSECLNPALVGAGMTGEERRLALAKAGIDDDHAWSYADFLAGKDCAFGQRLPNGQVCDKCATGEHAYCKRLKALRDNIKRLVFGMLYGAGIGKIAEIAGITLEFAKKIQELLFTKFPTIRTFMERTKWELRTFSMVEAFNGRRRRFLIGKGAPSDLRAQAERQAINFLVQGTSSDIVLSVLCAIAPVLERDMGGRLLLTVHDSVGFQVPKRYAHQMKDLVKLYGTTEVAKACPWLPAPYRWDVELGPSYGELSDSASYVAGLPPEYQDVGLGGYIEEEQFDDLRQFKSLYTEGA